MRDDGSLPRWAVVLFAVLVALMVIFGKRPEPKSAEQGWYERH